MKSLVGTQKNIWGCRSPCGERGLKYQAAGGSNQARMSLPVRGAWIEINLKMHRRQKWMSLPVRGAWIEINS